MEWRVDSSQPIDEELRDRVLDRIEEGTFCSDDLRDYFTIVTQICNNTEDVQDEVEGFDRRFLVKIDGEPAVWITIKDRKFEIGSGSIEAPDVTLDMSEQVAVDIFTGQVDPTAAYVNGELKVDGIIMDAMVFRDLLEIVQEELE